MKTTDITPKNFKCAIGACPKVFVDNQGNAYVIGKRTNQKQLGTELKLGEDETIVSVPLEMLRRIK